MFKIIFSEKAKKQYDQLSGDIKKKANRAIDYLGISPFMGFNIKKLKGELQDNWRYRIGDFRIIYSIGKGIVHVKVIEYRGKVY